MQEFDLDQLWSRAGEAAHAHYHKIEGQIEAMARKRSQNILYRVLRNSRYELWLSALMVPPFIWVFKGASFLWLFLLLAATALGFSIYLYVKLRNSLYAVNQYDSRHALAEYVRILRQYIRRLHVYTYLLVPIGFYVGFFGSMMEEPRPFYWEEDGLKLVFSVLLSAPLLVGLIWFIKHKYIYWLYGRHLDELEDTLAELELDESL